MEHIRENRDTPQFKALKQCAEDKCKEQFGKIKQLDGSFEPQIDCDFDLNLKEYQNLEKNKKYLKQQWPNLDLLKEL